MGPVGDFLEVSNVIFFRWLGVSFLREMEPITNIRIPVF